jgi:hypothetical protein
MRRVGLLNRNFDANITGRYLNKMKTGFRLLWYPANTFNKGVKTLDSPHVGYVVRETEDKIVVLAAMTGTTFQNQRSGLQQATCSSTYPCTKL